MAMAPRFAARQLSHPTGFLGAVFRHLMNRTNARMNASALTKLAVSSGDRVLEVGFGGGLTLKQLIEAASWVCGVDRSQQAVQAARARFARAVREGRAEFHQAGVESLPLTDGHFNKAISVNTVYFWSSLAAGFAELYRVLSPGGRIVIGFVPKESMDKMNMPKDIFTSRTPEEIIAAVHSAGFQDVRIEKIDAARSPHFAVAMK
jgi:ubiquinone/menaquinone biosynthesis C-methylase UbiE